jgi:hypothetical protein
MTGSNSPPAAVAIDEATTRWRQRGARLDANLQRNMRRVMSIVVAALTLVAIWMWLFR